MQNQVSLRHILYPLNLFGAFPLKTWKSIIKSAHAADSVGCWTVSFMVKIRSAMAECQQVRNRLFHFVSTTKETKSLPMKSAHALALVLLLFTSFLILTSRDRIFRKPCFHRWNALLNQLTQIIARFWSESTKYCRFQITECSKPTIKVNWLLFFIFSISFYIALHLQNWYGIFHFRNHLAFDFHFRIISFRYSIIVVRRPWVNQHCYEWRYTFLRTAISSSNRFFVFRVCLRLNKSA